MAGNQTMTSDKRSLGLDYRKMELEDKDTIVRTARIFTLARETKNEDCEHAAPDLRESAGPEVLVGVATVR